MVTKEQELMARAAEKFVAGNPRCRSEEQREAAAEGFLNGVHWAFSVMNISTQKWIESNELLSPTATQSEALR